MKCQRDPILVDTLREAFEAGQEDHWAGPRAPQQPFQHVDPAGTLGSRLAVRSGTGCPAGRAVRPRHPLKEACHAHSCRRRRLSPRPLLDRLHGRGFPAPITRFSRGLHKVPPRVIILGAECGRPLPPYAVLT